VRVRFSHGCGCGWTQFYPWATCDEHYMSCQPLISPHFQHGKEGHPLLIVLDTSSPFRHGKEVSPSSLCWKLNFRLQGGEILYYISLIYLYETHQTHTLGVGFRWVPLSSPTPVLVLPIPGYPRGFPYPSHMIERLCNHTWSAEWEIGLLMKKCSAHHGYRHDGQIWWVYIVSRMRNWSINHGAS